MQTFLPYPDFAQSAACLDRQRLGKQRVEGYQILRTLLGISSGWRNHPATKMWEGHEYQLRRYTQICIDEWTERGYTNNIVLPDVGLRPNRKYPWWWGLAPLHESHRSNLKRKAPHWYDQFNWQEPTDLPYWWPSQQQAA